MNGKMGSERRRNFTQEDGVSLKEFFLAKLEAQDKALELASSLMEHRLSGMNEFQKRMDRLEGTFVTRSELDLVLKNLKEDKRAAIATWIAFGSILVSVILYAMK